MANPVGLRPVQIPDSGLLVDYLRQAGDKDANNFYLSVDSDGVVHMEEKKTGFAGFWQRFKVQVYSSYNKLAIAEKVIDLLSEPGRLTPQNQQFARNLHTRLVKYRRTSELPKNQQIREVFCVLSRLNAYNNLARDLRGSGLFSEEESENFDAQFIQEMEGVAARSGRPIIDGMGDVIPENMEHFKELCERRFTPMRWVSLQREVDDPDVHPADAQRLFFTCMPGHLTGDLLTQSVVVLPAEERYPALYDRLTRQFSRGDDGLAQTKLSLDDLNMARAAIREGMDDLRTTAADYQTMKWIQGFGFSEGFQKKQMGTFFARREDETVAPADVSAVFSFTELLGRDKSVTQLIQKVGKMFDSDTALQILNGALRGMPAFDGVVLNEDDLVDPTEKVGRVVSRSRGFGELNNAIETEFLAALVEQLNDRGRALAAAREEVAVLPEGNDDDEVLPLAALLGGAHVGDAEEAGGPLRKEAMVREIEEAQGAYDIDVAERSERNAIILNEYRTLFRDGFLKRFLPGRDSSTVDERVGLINTQYHEVLPDVDVLIDDIASAVNGALSGFGGTYEEHRALITRIGKHLHNDLQREVFEAVMDEAYNVTGLERRVNTPNERLETLALSLIRAVPLVLRRVLADDDGGEGTSGGGSVSSESSASSGVPQDVGVARARLGARSILDPRTHEHTPVALKSALDQLETEFSRDVMLNLWFQSGLTFPGHSGLPEGSTHDLVVAHLESRGCTYSEGYMFGYGAGWSGDIDGSIVDAFDCLYEAAKEYPFPPVLTDTDSGEEVFTRSASTGSTSGASSSDYESDDGGTGFLAAAPSLEAHREFVSVGHLARWYETPGELEDALSAELVVTPHQMLRDIKVQIQARWAENQNLEEVFRIVDQELAPEVSEQIWQMCFGLIGDPDNVRETGTLEDKVSSLQEHGLPEMLVNLIKVAIEDYVNPQRADDGEEVTEALVNGGSDEVLPPVEDGKILGLSYDEIERRMARDAALIGEIDTPFIMPGETFEPITLSEFMRQNGVSTSF